MRRKNVFAVALLGLVTLLPASPRAIPAPALDTAAPAAGGATITVQYSNDFPVAAQTAVNFAANILAGLIESTQTIHVVASWSAELGGSTLAEASPIGLSFNRAGLVPDTFYAIALANSLANSDPASLPEISLSVNKTIVNWDFGTTGVSVPGQFNLATAALHELVHGIGFIAPNAVVSAGVGRLLNDLGAFPFPDIYSRFTETTGGQDLLTFTDSTTQLGDAMQAPSGVFWNGANGTAANGGTRPRLNIPATWAQNISYVHLDKSVYPAGNPNALMTAGQQPGDVVLHPGPVALGILKDMGWTLVDPCAPQFTPAAGTAPRGGGSFNVSVTLAAGCNWTAVNNNGFLHVISGTPGNGPGTVAYTVDANPTAGDRAGSLTIAGQTFNISQAGNTLLASPGTLFFSGVNNAGTLNPITPPQQVTVNFDGTGPGDWTATSNQPWAQITNGSGSGGGQFTIGIINPGNVLNGVTKGTARITLTAPNATNSPLTVLVSLSLQAAGTFVAPYGQVDTPIQGATNQQGAIALTGWVLDDVGVSTVKVYRPCLGFDNPASCNPVGGNSLVYVADAAFLAGARPDVEAVSPEIPLNYRAGWGVQILSNMLPHIPNALLYGGQGTFPFYVYATDYDGHMTLLGRSTPDHTPTTVTVTNDSIAKPFGTIDTPTLGETISGSKAVFGWVLTPDTNFVPDGTDILMATNGSGIVVYIDSMATAIVAYNHCRDGFTTPPTGGHFCADDIANIFGNAAPAAPLTPRASNPTRYRNLDANRGAIGVYVMNTTLLTNGLHTIAWGVADSAGRPEGIGSRFFTVLNGGAGRMEPSMAELLAAPAVSRGSAKDLDAYRASGLRISSRTGFSPYTPMNELQAGRDGVRAVSLGQLDRIELAFAMPVTRGHLVTNGQLRDLPVGATLDHKTGVFAWAPPAGYFGTYRLVFVIGSERVDVDVTVGATSKGLTRNDRR